LEYALMEVKTVVVPAARQHYEVEVSLLRDTYPPGSYKFSYGKAWPSEDGLYERPLYAGHIVTAEGLIRLFNMYLDPEVARNLRSELGILTA
jgi:hypothetical protein